MNSIGIWGGCYRLSEATYDIRNERFEVTVPEHSHWAYHANIFVAVGGHTRIRFKGWGCPYQDMAWYQREWWVHYLAQGDGSTIDDFGTFIWAYFTPVFEHMQGRTCEWGTAGWAQVTLTFRVYMDWGWFGQSALLSIEVAMVNCCVRPFIGKISLVYTDTFLYVTPCVPKCNLWIEL